MAKRLLDVLIIKSEQLKDCFDDIEDRVEMINQIKRQLVRIKDSIYKDSDKNKLLVISIFLKALRSSNLTNLTEMDLDVIIKIVNILNQKNITNADFEVADNLLSTKNLNWKR